jgi:hypothetical protein
MNQPDCAQLLLDFGRKKSVSLWRLTFTTSYTKQRRGLDAEGKRLFLDRSDRNPEPDRGPHGSKRLACRRLHAMIGTAENTYFTTYPDFLEVMRSIYSPESAAVLSPSEEPRRRA